MAHEELSKVLGAAWEAVRAIEPARGKVTAAQVLEVRGALEQIAAERARHDLTGVDQTALPSGSAAGRGQAPAVDADEVHGIDNAMAAIHARAAAVAIAAGDEANAERWLALAEPLMRDDELRAELVAARRAHERYRALVHGRNLFAQGKESAARTIWARLSKDKTAVDELARAATAELQAPRPLRPGDSPTLSRINGIGAGFYGRRDVWSDGSYATTHCISVVWVPVFALSAWRVMDADGGYRIFAREQLSPFAKLSRWLVLGGIALAITGFALNAHFNDPERLARLRWDEAVAVAQRSSPEAALQALDDELARDVWAVDAARAERAGAEVVRLSAGFVAAPLVPDKVDQAIRVVRRYQALPDRARAGAAEDALFTAVDRWIQELAKLDAPASSEAQLALASAAVEGASGPRKDALATQIAQTRLALAAAKQAEWPLDALAILVAQDGQIHAGPEIAAADAIVASLAASPSLLLDAGSDLDAWEAATGDAELRTRIKKLHATAEAGRTAAEAEGVTPKQLAAMQAERPWDQHVALQLAQRDAGAAKLDAAAARLGALGPPGRTIRAVRFLRAQITAGQGKLDDADAQLTALLGTRVQRFAAASAALREAGKAAQRRIDLLLRMGSLPEDLKRRYETATESARSEMIETWVGEQLQGDAAGQAARARYVAFGDVVPMAVSAGSVKLRRAQAMSGPARDRMLEDAERTFLAIRTEAEGQPEFRLALGEIYARLGKTAESDAELAAVLAKDDPQLKLAVAEVYRNVGSAARASQIATQVFEQSSSPLKESAAHSLAVMAEDETAEETWYRKADQRNAGVKAALLAIEGRQLERAGKTAECAAKFAAAAKVYLSTSNRGQSAGYNNAALEYEHGFDCSGDPQALRDAEAALETAYRSAPEEPLVIANLSNVLAKNGQLRVLARHIGVRALRLQLGDVDTLIDELLDGPERATLLAELAADPGLRRSSELLAQAEVLMPNNPVAYQLRFAEAARRRNVEDAAAIVERARRAKGLDVSSNAAARERWRSGVDDARMNAGLENSLARLEAVLASPGGDRLDPKTRAVGRFLMARAFSVLGIYRADKAALGRAREAAAAAMQLWPAFEGEAVIVSALIDEAGLDAGDAKAWVESRRMRTTSAALDQLVLAGDPLAAKIRASKQWADAASHVKIGAFPGLGDLRLARLIGNPALEARARAVLDDKLVRLRLELRTVINPGDPSNKEDLAYLDRR